MEPRDLDPQDSLHIIHSMIRSAKGRLANDGFLFVFWGWLVFTATLIFYFSLIIHINYGYYIWPLISLLGITGTVLYLIHHEKNTNVRTYIDKYLAYTWFGFMLSITLDLSFIGVNGLKSSYFFLMLLYGFATLISGGILNFRPLIAGSMFSFVFAGLSFLFSEEQQLLLICGCILFSYIIPGHILRWRYN